MEGFRRVASGLVSCMVTADSSSGVRPPRATM
jgi:hypothetical protein